MPQPPPSPGPSVPPSPPPPVLASPQTPAQPPPPPPKTKTSKRPPPRVAVAPSPPVTPLQPNNLKPPPPRPRPPPPRPPSPSSTCAVSATIMRVNTAIPLDTGLCSLFATLVMLPVYGLKALPSTVALLCTVRQSTTMQMQLTMPRVRKREKREHGWWCGPQRSPAAACALGRGCVAAASDAAVAPAHVRLPPLNLWAGGQRRAMPGTASIPAH